MKRVVMLRALGLGDFLTGLPAMRAIKRAYANYEVVLATTPRSVALAQHAGVADAVVPVNELAALPQQLRGCEIAFNLHGKGPQSHRLLQQLSPHRLIAFANTEIGNSGPEWIDAEHEVDRWCRLVEAFDIPAQADDLYIECPDVELPIDTSGDVTVLHPGAAYGSRRWPEARWVEVARRESASGRSVILTGSEAEAELCLHIATASGLGADAVAAGRTNLAQLMRLIDCAARVVVGDTGVAHLATALRTPSVVLFGPVSPELWGPTVDRSMHVVLWKGQSGNPHGSEVDAGLNEITVDEVLDAMRHLPQLSATAR
jgi:ADP-heptose:LPS heptosyltransferase